MQNIVSSIKMARSLVSLQWHISVVFCGILYFEYFSYFVFPFLNSSSNLVAKKGCKTALFLNWPYEKFGASNGTSHLARSNFGKRVPCFAVQ